MLAPPGRAAAQDSLAAADRAYDDGHLQEAAREYGDALATGALDPAALVRAHVRLGVLAALEGDTAAMERHFTVALALDPVRDAPEELSPDLAARFDTLRDAREGRRLALAIDRTDAAGLQLEVRDAPEGLVRTIVVRGGGDWERRFAWEGEPIAIDPPAVALPVEADALDAQGNRLARAGARIAAPVIVRVEEPIEAPRPGDGARNLIESPWLWVVVGAVILGVAVAVGVSASGDRYLLESAGDPMKGRLLALAALFLSGCITDHVIHLELHPPRAPDGGPDVPPEVASYELRLYRLADTEACPDATMVATAARYAQLAQAQSFDRASGMGDAIGEIPSGRYAVAALARAADCGVVLFGCSELAVGVAAPSTVVVALAPVSLPADCGPCRTCSSGACDPVASICR